MQNTKYYHVYSVNILSKVTITADLYPCTNIFHYKKATQQWATRPTGQNWYPFL